MYIHMTHSEKKNASSYGVSRERSKGKIRRNTLWQTNIAMVVTFHSYISLPEVSVINDVSDLFGGSVCHLLFLFIL